jgi:hypothetical protein
VQAPKTQVLPLAQSLSLPHEVGQVAAVPLHANGAQLGDPALPIGAGVQAPGVELHTWHGRLHADWQHTPETQKPELHSLPVVHI